MSQTQSVTDEVRMLHREATDCQILCAYLARLKDPQFFSTDTQPASAQPADNSAVEIPRKILESSTTAADAADVMALHALTNRLSAAAFPATAQSIRDSRFSQLLGIEESDLRKRDWHWRAMLGVGAVAFAITVLIAFYLSFTDKLLKDYHAGVLEFHRIKLGTLEGTRLEAYNYYAKGAGAKPLSSPPSDKSGTSPPAPAAGAEASAPEATPVAARDGPPSATSTDQQTGAAAGAPSADEANSPTAGAPGADAQDQNQGNIPDEGALKVDLDQTRQDALVQIGLELKAKRMMIKTMTGLAWLWQFDNPKYGGDDKERLILDETAVNLLESLDNLFSNFYLPMFAAIVGAFVFIVRDRTKRLDSVTLISQQTALYWPRVIVAAVAGLIIGWFTNSDATGVLSKLTPAAAAFLVGYSIEIFFNILDSIKTALGVKDG